MIPKNDIKNTAHKSHEHHRGYPFAPNNKTENGAVIRSFGEINQIQSEREVFEALSQVFLFFSVLFVGSVRWS